MILALPRLLSCPLLIPSQRISVQRLRYLGHLLRHFEALEHRTSGASLLHSVLVDSQKLFTVLSNLEEISIPPPKKFPIQCTPRALNIYFGPSLADWYDTTAIWTTLSPIAMDHDEWDQIVFPGNLMVHSNTADV